MAKIAAKGSDEDLLRRMLRGCMREPEFTIHTASNDQAVIIEPAKERFLGRIDAAAGKLGCNKEQVAAVKSNLHRLVEFTIFTGPLAPPVSAKPQKKHGKPKPPPPPRDRDVTVLAVLRSNYDKTLSSIISARPMASSAASLADSMPSGLTVAVGAASSSYQSQPT